MINPQMQTNKIIYFNVQIMNQKGITMVLFKTVMNKSNLCTRFIHYIFKQHHGYSFLIHNLHIEIYDFICLHLWINHYLYRMY